MMNEIFRSAGILLGLYLSLFGKRSWNLWILAVSLAFVVVPFHQREVNQIPDSIVYIIIWVLCVLLSDLLRNVHRGYRILSQQQIKQKKENLRSLNLSESIIKTEIQSLELSLLEKEALYESLKEINRTLEFSKTVEVFSSIASKMTSFDDGFVMLYQELSRDHASIIYRIYRDEPPLRCDKNTFHPSDFDLEAVSLTHQGKTLIFIDRPETDPRLASFTVPPNTLSLTSLGLHHEGQLNGAIILHGCKKKEVESLELLGIQLAMEIEKARLYEKVRTLSIVDGLTQTYQRRHFFNLLDDEIKRLEKQNCSCSILMLDIDHFKGFNDNFGHLVGDILLKELSLAIQENLRPMDLMGRYGGEEFVIALPETSSAEAMQIAQRIRSDIQTRNFVIHDKIFKLTISIGISIYPDQSKDLSTLIEMADRALYKVKGSGRNQVMHFMNERVNPS